jgi:hypothetical protein
MSLTVGQKLATKLATRETLEHQTSLPPARLERP